MSTNSGNSRSMADGRTQGGESMGAGVIPLLFLATLKYLPVVILGFIFGKIAHQGASPLSGFRRGVSIVLGLLFFAGLLFVLFGSPEALQNPRNFPGLLFYSDAFRSGVIELVRAINSFVPNLPGFKLLKFDAKHLTFLSVGQYAWVSMIAAIFMVALSEVHERTRREKSARRRTMGWLTRSAGFPAHAIYTAWIFLIQIWVELGHTDAWKVRNERFRHFFGSVIGTLVFASFSAWIVAYPVLWIPYPNIKTVVSYLVFSPVLGFAFGFVVGLIPFGMGDQLLGFLFGSHPGGTPTPKGEFVLGIDHRGGDYSLTSRNLGYHVEMVAPTGGGKTNLLKNLILDRIRRGHGVIFLDLKAEFEVVRWMMAAATESGREGDFRLVSLANRELSVPYNPVKHGSAAEIHSQLMNSMTWSEDYYRKIASIALMTLLRGLTEYRDKTGENFSLGHIYALLTEEGLLRAFNQKLQAFDAGSVRELGELALRLDRPSEREKLSGLVANLNMLIFSAAGPLMSEDVARGSFDFVEAINQGRITYFLINSLKLKESASVFGKLIIQDLMRFAGDRYSAIERRESMRPVTLIVDEFAAFATPEFIEFMDRARGAGIGIVIAHQSRADLRSISPEFQQRVEANANTVIITGKLSPDDAEHYAGMLGTRKTEKETRQVQDGFFGQDSTGMKSIREVEEYIIHPNELKDLRQGEVFTISQTVDPRWGMIRVPRAPEVAEQALSAAQLTEKLSLIRANYMAGGTDRYLDLGALRLPAGLTREGSPSESAQKSPVVAQQSELWN